MFFFLLGRCFFLLYHINSIVKLPLAEILLAFIYGIILDISFASYISICVAAFLPFLLVLKISITTIQKTLLIFTVFWITLLTLIYTIDAELFTFWGFRLDNTLFRYTSTPAEMIGSTMSSPLWLLLPFFGISTYLAYRLYKKLFIQYPFTHLKFWQVPIALFFAAIFIIPIRGGLQQIPNNESVGYYSNHLILNQAALNPAWTLARSVIEQNGPDLSYYTSFDSAEAKAIVAKHLQAMYPNNSDHLLNSNRPNIILIVWESLTANVLNDTVTPGLNRLKNEGIYFSNVFASGDRSDKGLVALLSAYPAQPDYSIMTEPGKSRKLPFITQQLKDAGYKTGYIYGGELEFANMRSYMNYNGFEEIIGKSDFPKETWGAKWGAHDEFTFDKLLTNINQASKNPNPFFYTLFTLSSHEPFDVPAKPALSGSSKSTQFKNAHHYTDSCFTDFIAKAKKQSWWNNTWIIVVGDHGHILPQSEYANHIPREFHIPMVWIGGAIQQKQETANTYSQINLAPSIAAYLNLKPQAFQFSKPINLTDTIQNPAWYSFNDGFASVYGTDHYVMYRLTDNKINLQKGPYSDKDLTYGKAFLQVVMEDFYKK
jgi:phosphoglycerol transferase MdoB-like AlkP superfamily enzyme